MRPAHAIIAWTPAHVSGTPTRGQVLVGKWMFRRAPHWALGHARLAGATTGARRSMADVEALHALRLDYAALRADGIAPDVINAAFAAIDGWVPR